MRSKTFSYHYTVCIAVIIFSAAAGTYADWHLQPAGYSYFNSLVTDSSGQRLWVGTYSYAGFWNSEDGGSNWLPVSSRIRAEDRLFGYLKQAIDARADTLIVEIPVNAQPYGIPDYFRSYDGGQSWQTMSATHQFRSVLARQSRHNEWIGQLYRMLYRSTDWGMTWSDSTSLPFHAIRLFQDTACDSCLFATSYGDWSSQIEFRRSTDLGFSWQPPAYLSYLDSNNSIRKIVRLSNGQIAVIIRYDPILMSDDQGQSWHSWDTSPDVRHAMDLIEDPSLPGHLYLLAYELPGGLLRSWDYGRSWYPCGQNLPEYAADGTILYQNPFSLDLYIETPDYGLYRSTDHGDTWQQVGSPPISDASVGFSITPEAIFSYSFDYAIRREWQLSSRNGLWQRFSIPTVSTDTLYRDVSPVFFKHGDSMASLVYETDLRDTLGQSKIRRALSVDNGISWTLGIPRYGFQYIDPVPSGINTTVSRRWLLVSPSNQSNRSDTLLVSHNMGLTWEALWRPPNPDFGQITHLAQEDSDICILTGSHFGTPSIMYVSTNAGSTWRAVREGRNYRSDPMIVGQSIFVVDSVRLTRWNGRQWDSLGTVPDSDEYNRVIIAIARPESETTFILFHYAINSTFLISTDLGYSWIEHPLIAPFHEQNNTFIMMTWDPYRERLWASTAFGPCYLDGEELAINDGPLHFKPADFTVLSAYPNPFNSTTKIRYDLDRRSRVEIKIFDLQGRLVTTLLDDIAEPGRHEISWNADNIGSGTYFVRLKTPQGVHTQKLLLLK